MFCRTKSNQFGVIANSISWWRLTAHGTCSRLNVQKRRKCAPFPSQNCWGEFRTFSFARSKQQPSLNHCILYRIPVGTQHVQATVARLFTPSGTPFTSTVFSFWKSTMASQGDSLHENILRHQNKNVLKKYEVLHVLGTGSMGTVSWVWVCFDLEFLIPISFFLPTYEWNFLLVS